MNLIKFPNYPTEYTYNETDFIQIFPHLKPSLEEARYLHIISNNVISLKKPKYGIQGWRIREEVMSLQQFQSNPYIVSYYGWCMEMGTPYICHEPMDICLSRFRFLLYLNKKRRILFAKEILAHITVVILQVVNFLNNLGYCHGNIHRAAVLMRRDGCIKISCFEYTWSLNSNGNCQDLYEGESYVSPERIFEENSLDLRNDLWTLGAMLTDTVSDHPLETNVKLYY